MWLASCFPGCQPPFSFFLCLFFYCVVVFFVSFPLPFFFLSFFSLHVSVLFPSCIISPVSLFLVSDTRVSCIPRPGCQTYRDPDVRHAKTRVSNMSRPGCRTMPFRISVFSFSLPLFLSACMRIYYNVSLLPDFPSSLKKYVLQHICQSAFYKNVQEKRKKSPDIFGVYVIKSYFCTRFREREQRCFDILTGTA